MKLSLPIWTKEDIEPFLTYLRSFQRKEKEAWARKILNTKLDLLVIPTKTMHQITDDIYQGNFKSFLDLQIFDCYESIAIYGLLMTRIKPFHDMKPYVNIYTHVMENWAHCDLLSFHITDQDQKEYLLLSKELLNDEKHFARRLSLFILFQCIKDPSVLPIVFQSLEMLIDEKEYYVIMMAGWLLSECIIKYKHESLAFITTSMKLNKKILNKGIQKCRESRRLTQIEKDELLQYKK